MELFEFVPDLGDIGVRAFTTRRELGTLSTNTEESAREVAARWDLVRGQLAPTRKRIATSRQVHGAHILQHNDGWSGWLRSGSADGHLSLQRGTAMGISVADCVPILVAHPSGACAALHAGWRGAAAGILQRAIAMLESAGCKAADLRVHFGPAICGACYEVGSEVYQAVSGRVVNGKAHLDIRAELAQKASAAGVSAISLSDWCTRHNNERFFSHRAGDAGRQFAFIVADD